MNLFEALASGNVVEFENALKINENTPAFLALMTKPPHNQTLIAAALSIPNPTPNQATCFRFLVEKLAKGKQLPVETLIQALVQPNAYRLKLSDNLPDTQVRMLDILFPLYCDSDKKLAETWGDDKVAQVKDQLIEAINAVRVSSGCSNVIFDHVRQIVVNNDEIDFGYKAKILNLLVKLENEDPTIILFLTACNNNQEDAKTLFEERGVKLETLVMGVKLLGSCVKYDLVNDYKMSEVILTAFNAVNAVDIGAADSAGAMQKLKDACDEKIKQIASAREAKEKSLKTALKNAVEKGGDWTSELKQVEDYCEGDKTGVFDSIISGLGLAPDGKKLIKYTQAEIEKVFQENNLSAVKALFPDRNALTKPDAKELAHAIVQIGDVQSTSTDAFKISISIVDHLFDQSSFAHGQTKEIKAITVPALQRKQVLLTAYLALLGKNLKIAIDTNNPDQIAVHFRALESHYIGASKSGDGSYNITHLAFVEHLKKLGLDENGKRIVNPIPALKVEAKEELDKALKAVVSAFLSPDSTDASFEPVIDSLKATAKKFLALYPNKKEINEIELVSQLLSSITMKTPGSDQKISLLEYAYVNGLRTAEGGGVNESVLISFESALTEEDRLKLLSKIPEEKIHNELKEIVENLKKEASDAAKTNASHVRFKEPADELEAAKKHLAEVFVNPNATVVEFNEAYERLEFIFAMKQVHNGFNERDDNAGMFRAFLMSITVTMADVTQTLLEYVTAKGLKAVGTPDGVNPDVHQAFQSLLDTQTVEDVLPDLMSPSSSSSSSSRTVYSYDSPADNPPEKDLLKIYNNIIDAVTNPDKSISAVNISVMALKTYFNKKSETHSDAAFISALKHLNVLPSNKPLLLLAIQMPENAIAERKKNAIVVIFNQHLGAEITDGVPETDPLVVAVKAGKYGVVAELLPYYADSDHWKGDEKRAADVMKCLKLALAEAGAGAVTNPAFFLPVFVKFYKCDALKKIAEIEESVGSIKDSIREGLCAEIARLFADGKADEKALKIAIKNLEAFFEHTHDAESAYSRSHLYQKALANEVLLKSDDKQLTMMEYAGKKGIYSDDNEGGVKIEILQDTLETLLESGSYANAIERKMIYDSAENNREVQGIMRIFFTQHPISGSDELLPAYLELSNEACSTYIVDLFLYPGTTAKQFNVACDALKATLPKKTDAELAKALLDIEFGKSQTLLGHACANGIYSSENKTGVKHEVFDAFVSKVSCRRDDMSYALTSIKTIHPSVNPLLDTYKTPVSTYKTAAITGAAWVAGMATLAIIGVLADAFLFGENSKLEGKLYSLANWCWRNPFGNSSQLSNAGHSESHEAEMLSCVGTVALIAAAAIGGCLGAGKHAITKPKPKAGT